MVIALVYEICGCEKCSTASALKRPCDLVAYVSSNAPEMGAFSAVRPDLLQMAAVEKYCRLKMAAHEDFLGSPESLKNLPQRELSAQRIKFWADKELKAKLKRLDLQSGAIAPEPVPIPRSSGRVILCRTPAAAAGSKGEM